MASLAPSTSVADGFFTDPNAKHSWYYSSSRKSALKIDVESVWEDYTGEGILIGVLDSQIDYNHTDLQNAYDLEMDYNFDLGTDNITIDSSDLPHPHGTMVAGVIGAEGGNGVGSVGIASGASLIGLGINYSSDQVVEQAIAGLNAAVALDVVNCSWSFVDNFADNFNKNSDMAEAVENLATNGRDGLGTSVVFAAGNVGTTGSSNYHDFQNSPYTIAVGAVDLDGNPAWFTSIGANVLVSGPGVDVVTTTLKDRYTDVSGTSFAAPVVSAVVGLMLEANPELGYRDVQQILALSARRDGLTDEALHGDGWQINGATNVNGGGMHYSDVFGYGFVNAHDAVRLAETWTLQQTVANRTSVDVAGDVEADLVAGSQDHISFTVDIDQALMAEHVELSLDLRWKYTADLDVYLTSPEGTTVRLVYDLPEDDSGTGGSLRNFSFTSVASMGELATGTWTVDIYNRNTDAIDSKTGEAMTGYLDDFSMTVHGRSEGLEDDTYVYTDELGILYADSDDKDRWTLDDTDGGIDAINAAAVTSDSRIDLSGAGKTTIAGVDLTLASAGDIENIFAGDGDDTLFGNQADNLLSGGRGDDLLHYSSGADSLFGDAGIDTLLFDTVFASVSGYLTDAGELMIGMANLGFSLVTGVESFGFSDVVYSFSDILTVFAGNSVPAEETTKEDTTGGTTEEETPASETTGGTAEETTEEETVAETPEETPAYDTEIFGGTGNDKLRGTNGVDHLVGDSGNDYLLGRDGDDVLDGGADNDKLRGGTGDDSLMGGDGIDRVMGDNGNDTLLGGAGNDKIYGGEGDDVINGGAGADFMRGDEGADSFVFDINDVGEIDTIRDFNAAEGDRIVLTGFSPNADNITFSFVEGRKYTYLEMNDDGVVTRLAQIKGEQLDTLELTTLSDDAMYFG